MYQCQPCLLGDVIYTTVTYYDAKLFECWPVGPTIKQHWFNVSYLLGSAPVINSRPNTATLTKCWASVVGGVPALKQRWLHVIVQRYGQYVPEAYRTTLSWHKKTLNKCWFNVYSPSTTLDQRLANFDSTSCLCWPANTHVWDLYNMPIGHSLPNKTNIHSMWH